MKMILILFLFVYFNYTSAVIYTLNDTQYALMPPLVHLDPYEECQLDADALYCTAELVLTSEEPSSLLDMIQEYSEHDTSHYNHTKLRYGICITQTCKEFYENERGDLKLTLEACLNESFTNKYELKVNVLEGYTCRPPGKNAKEIDVTDYIVGIICIILMLFNLVGSLSDNIFGDNSSNKVIIFLSYFSLKRNWNKLVTPTAEGRDPRLQRFESLHGLRTMMTCFVILGHALLLPWILPHNPHFLEKVYTMEYFSIISNGVLIMQVFLMMSAFLLVYLWLLDLEKHQMTWSMLPQKIVKRWLRLTPSYAAIIALTATWFGHLSSGPLWTRYVAKEMNDCRQYWWRNILYINNFFNDSECVAQSWYLATDTQLHCLAVVIFLACRTARSRIIVLSTLFLVGIVTPAAIVYSLDLSALQMLSPEIVYKLVISDPYFSNVYERSYCNLSGFVVGMAMAYLVYYWQNKGVDFKQYQNFIPRMLYWTSLPLAVLCCCSGSIFYLDVPRLSIYIRTMYAALALPVFSLVSAIFVTGLIIKFEGVYRSFLEWRGWVVPSKLSYLMYLIHMVFVRNNIATQTDIGRKAFIQVCLTTLVMSFVAAFFFWILVEAPISNIVEECLLKSKRTLKDIPEKTAVIQQEQLLKIEYL